MKRIIIYLAVVAVAAFAIWKWSAPADDNSGSAMAEVNVPTLSQAASQGKAVFDDNCAACHGENAAGKNGSGPPLVHKIYEPNHHGDQAFQLAAKLGVRNHHWRFGNMPAIESVTSEDVSKVVVYVRELQRANNIE